MQTRSPFTPSKETKMSVPANVQEFLAVLSGNDVPQRGAPTAGVEPSSGEVFECIKTLERAGRRPLAVRVKALASLKNPAERRELVESMPSEASVAKSAEAAQQQARVSQRQPVPASGPRDAKEFLSGLRFGW
jgi:hypothetical protein